MTDKSFIINLDGQEFIVKGEKYYRLDRNGKKHLLYRHSCRTMERIEKALERREAERPKPKKIEPKKIEPKKIEPKKIEPKEVNKIEDHQIQKVRVSNQRATRQKRRNITSIVINASHDGIVEYQVDRTMTVWASRDEMIRRHGKSGEEALMTYESRRIEIEKERAMYNSQSQRLSDKNLSEMSN